MEKLPLYILAGGKSSRFGSDKALADAGGVPLMLRVAKQWAAWASNVCVVADRADRYAELRVRTIADLQPGMGPLAGLAAALADRKEGWIVLAGCDAMLMDAAIPLMLINGISEKVDAVALRNERWEPLPALFHARALPAVQAALAQNRLSLWRLIEAIPHQAVALSSDGLFQLNTPSDLAAFMADQRAKPMVPPPPM